MVDTKRRLDTVGALETQLAKQGRPSEDLNTIDEQIDNHRVGVVSYFIPYFRTKLCDHRIVPIL